MRWTTSCSTILPITSRVDGLTGTGYSATNVLDLVSSVLLDEDYLNDMATRSCMSVLMYLGVRLPVCMYSSRFFLQEKERNEKIIYMCDGLDTTTYINAIGGKDLYTQKSFPFDLRFLRTGDITYSQKRDEFIPNLSIIDVLMFNSPEVVREFLTNYTLEQ